MNSLSEVSIFAVVLAVNLFLFGALLSGGLAVVLRFTENAAPRVRYLISISVFLLAVFIPLAVTSLNNSAGQKALIVFAESEIKQKIESSENQNYVLTGKTDASDLPPVSGNSNENFINGFILMLTNSLVGNLFLGVWIFGCCRLFLREAVGVRRLGQARKLWTRASDCERESLNCPRNIPLYFADDQTPGTFGGLRPAIVLPNEFPTAISLESQRFIVRHEISHARWRDPLLRFLLRAFRNLFWISPALWLIEHLIDAECEAAADRAAIHTAEKQNSRTNALNYAEILLLIAKSFKSAEGQKRQPQLVGIGAESNLEIRIRRLLSACRTTRRQIASAIGACLLTVVTTAVIPVASFSEIIEKVNSESDFSAGNQNKFSAVKSGGDSSFGNDPGFLPPVEMGGETDKISRSEISLKKSISKNSSSADETSAVERQARSDSPDFDSADHNEASSAKTMSDEAARNAELRKNQRAASELNNLGNLSAMNDSEERPQRLPNLELTRESLTILQTDDDLARRKSVGEMNSRRAYSPNLSATAPRLKPYVAKYVPYPAKRREP